MARARYPAMTTDPRFFVMEIIPHLWDSSQVPYQTDKSNVYKLRN